MAQNENYSQVDLRVGTEAQFNAKVDTLPAGTLFGVTDATVSKADLSTDLKNEINGKITQPSTPTGDSAVVIDSNGVVSTKLLSDIGSGITVDFELSDSSENPVQNKVINSALNSKVNNTTTVNGHALSSNVTVTKSDIGLGNVDNTSDANKPISNATQAALNEKQNTLSAGTNIDITNNTISTKNVPTLSGDNTFTGSNTFSGSGDPQVVFQGDNGSVILETTPGNSNITITIPNAADGTLALLSDIPTIPSTDDFAKKSSSNTFTQQNTFTGSVRFSDTVKSYNGFTADNSSNSHYAKYSYDNIVYYKDLSTAYTYEFPNSSGTLLTSNDVTDILKKIYPVGSVYINRTNNNNPGTLLGFGTWTRISDRFLYAATTSSTTLGVTGGENTHKLTIDEMPSHNHSFDGWGSVAGNNGYVSGASSRNITSVTSFSMNDTGGNQAHNNMPKYVVVSIWYRVS